MLIKLRATDLKQWAYCPRIVYYQHRMPGVGKQTYKMSEGKAAQEMIEQLEMRRTLKEYGLEDAARRFGVWLESDDLGLAGKLDLLVEGASDAAIVEFKLTSGEVGSNHRFQIAGYAMLVEAVVGKAVRTAFVYRIPDNRVFPISIDEHLRHEVSDAMIEMRKIVSIGQLPEPTEVRKRCEECEYANYCGDVW